MQKNRRRPFFIKNNFQIRFIIGFVAVIFIEVIAAGLFIYKFSKAALEKEAFRSHIIINKSVQVIKPVIFKVNVSGIIIIIALASVIVTITYFRNRSLFRKIVDGLEKLRDNHLSCRIEPAGGKKATELINEFNAAASYFRQRRDILVDILDKLIAEKEIKNIEELHNRLSAIISEKDPA